MYGALRTAFGDGEGLERVYEKETGTKGPWKHKIEEIELSYSP